MKTLKDLKQTLNKVNDKKLERCGVGFNDEGELTVIWEDADDNELLEDENITNIARLLWKIDERMRELAEKEEMTGADEYSPIEW